MADAQEPSTVVGESVQDHPSQPERTLTIKIKLGADDDRSFELRPGCRLREVLEVVALEQGLRVEELLLFRGEEEEPVAAEIIINADYPCERRHHLHHKSEVEVSIFYQSKDHRHAFRRHTTVGHVLIWAIKVFGIDPTMAGEFDLTLHGSKDALPESEHIGHLTGKNTCLELDLVRGDIANGASRKP